MASEEIKKEVLAARNEDSTYQVCTDDLTAAVRIPAYSMGHLNGRLLCVLDTETTGLDPVYNEIIQICVMPLGIDLEPMRGVLPFDMLLKPDYPGRISDEAMRVNKRSMDELLRHGHDQAKAADLFDAWYRKLPITSNKYGAKHKISLLGHNIHFDLAFVSKWLGRQAFDEYFHHDYRDTMTAALMMNDNAGYHLRDIEFPKVNLQYIATTLKIPTKGQAHTALADCLVTAKIYKHFVTRGLF